MGIATQCGLMGTVRYKQAVGFAALIAGLYPKSSRVWITRTQGLGVAALSTGVGVDHSGRLWLAMAKKGTKGGYYAVHRGRGGPTVYSTWDECSAAVKGFPSARYKKFSTQREADAFAATGGASASAGVQLQASQPAHRSSQARHLSLPAAFPMAAAAPAPAARPVVNISTDVDGTIWFDGGSRGNPGIAGAGACLKGKMEELIWEGCEYVGNHGTNNQAEYTGMIIGLRAALQHGCRRLAVVGDSKLIINQMKGTWQCNNANILPLYRRACGLATQFQHISWHHVLREYNKHADMLANQAMDTRHASERWLAADAAAAAATGGGSTPPPPAAAAARPTSAAAQPENAQRRAAAATGGGAASAAAPAPASRAPRTLMQQAHGSNAQEVLAAAAAAQGAGTGGVESVYSDSGSSSGAGPAAGRKRRRRSKSPSPRRHDASLYYPSKAKRKPSPGKG
eukprot:TRINITY_DN11322_c0_g1_i4.p1 TRINITY_DN11322_c0_g1~~TRINITY_DN11322_c0_g1_i4.p1  ORF type:complete len:455 (+),score=107.60 TRINITY_DN11322_c0_g1_i4:104-1468(+)